jgi:hypothetical protein
LNLGRCNKSRLILDTRLIWNVPRRQFKLGVKFSCRLKNLIKKLPSGFTAILPDAAFAVVERLLSITDSKQVINHFI